MMVDLAVPRDIEPEVAQLGDVYLYTVDDLGRVVQEGREARSAAVIHAEQIIEARVNEFLRWQSARRGIPIIQTLQHHAHSIRQSELDKALKQLATGAEVAQVLEQLSRQLTQKLMHGSLSLTQQLAADPLVDLSILQAVQRSYKTHRT
jgi:glutamyl-tRNA reductase